MTDSVPDTKARREYVADIDASLDVLQRLHDDVRAHGAALVASADKLAESIGRLAVTRRDIMDGVWADEARARSSNPDVGFVHQPGLAS